MLLLSAVVIVVAVGVVVTTIVVIETLVTVTVEVIVDDYGGRLWETSVLVTPLSYAGPRRSLRPSMTDVSAVHRKVNVTMRRSMFNVAAKDVWLIVPLIAVSVSEIRSFWAPRLT